MADLVLHGFEWDEDKRRSNLAKHGVDFFAAAGVFDGVHVQLPGRTGVGERRFGVYGRSAHGLLFVVYAWRDGRRRIISARKAGTFEQEAFWKAVGGAGAAAG